MASLSSFGRVTVWTVAGFDTGNGKQKSTEKTRSGYFFESEEFDVYSAPGLSERLKRCHEDFNRRDIPFIVIARIQGDTPWLSAQLRSVFPGADTIRDVVDSRRQQRGTVALPKIDKKSKTLSFSMQYPYIGPEPYGSPKTSRIQFASIATRISTLNEVPTILLVCCDEEIPQRLQSHLVSGNWQCTLLKQNPARMFIDLLILLTEWADVWAIARQELAQRDLQVHTDELPLLRKTKELHRDAAEIIALREDLRLHVTAVRRFSVMVGAQGPMMAKLGLLCGKNTNDVYEEEELEELVDECLRNLLHQQESAAVIHKQLENLLSLAFNTEMVSQGQAVARLNFLAFIFLPLSFVATVFGMTRFTISAVWYPLSALVVIILVLLGFVAANYLPRNLLGILNNRWKALFNSKIQQGKKTLSPREFPDRKAKRFAWLKPNRHWWWVVPIVPIAFFVLRRYRNGKENKQRYQPYQVPAGPVGPMAYEGPSPLGAVDLDCMKVMAPEPQSYLHSQSYLPTSGMQTPTYAQPSPTYLQPFSPSMLEQRPITYSQPYSSSTVPQQSPISLPLQGSNTSQKQPPSYPQPYGSSISQQQPPTYLTPSASQQQPPSYMQPHGSNTSQQQLWPENNRESDDPQIESSNGRRSRRFENY
ncbi:hypothetical protein K458DRAFT_432248 [Lentithecium fluviatile CBS 122367]|uniref:Cora-domain-containing protein n=1 Tax=Lentithecium fluviatile CBS 122367 TaxID=1168545 RepID=A0A6G1IZZ5_9PLEO|nr:hypothetical protein K458DRAFT_432248 [Lentithecium fluviatile CBS 122367]